MNAIKTAPLTSQPCDVPPWVDDPSALVIVDWSGWLCMAWAIKDLDMVSMVVGWLCNHVLSYQPAHLALALDAPPPTTRHRMTHPTDPEWRYKAGRTVKPPAFFDLSARCTEIAELHAIPCLWAPEQEADDVIATITAQARALGYRVWIATKDKDLHGLVEGEGRNLSVGIWDPFNEAGGRAGGWRGPAEVRAKWGVEPAQMADFLAIVGDAGDNVPGVDGLGPGAAASILRSFGTLDRALTEPAWMHEDFTSAEQQIAALAKAAKKGDATAPEKRTILVSERAVERHRAKLIDATDVARFSRDLTALDCNAAVDVPWEQIPLGGYDVDGLRRRYEAMGFERKAREVAGFPKRAPWSIP